VESDSDDNGADQQAADSDEHSDSEPDIPKVLSLKLKAPLASKNPGKFLVYRQQTLANSYRTT
jgi:hypothetical protein